MPLMLVGLLIWGGTAGAVVPANADAGHCRPAELFATDNTEGELRLFELQASATIARRGATVTGSTLLDGVFWSEELQQATAERSRQFHLCVVDEPTLHAVAEELRQQFHQQAVLTFDYLPENAAETNAVTITVPGVDIARFHDAFVADSVAHQRLLGGSVTTDDHTLILIADTDDVETARRLVTEAGGDWTSANLAPGDREFVR